MAAPDGQPSSQEAWALLVEYDGGPFQGWQRQAESHGLTVQGVLDAAAVRMAGGRAVAPSAAAGRTDAGVHASGQVAMLLLPPGFSEARVQDGLNFHLRPHPVAVLRAARAPEGWHPRFSATGRAYVYHILNRRARPALARGRVWHVERMLDAAAMAEAARGLVGRHDFTSFRAAACQASGPVRTLDRLEVVRIGDMVEVRAAARSFLHHQVRNMVGTLKLVGDGRWQPGQVMAALAARDRAAAGPTAPADGLVLVGVEYGAEVFGGLPG